MTLREQYAQLCESIAQLPQAPPEHWHEQARRARQSAAWWRQWSGGPAGQDMATRLEERAQTYDELAHRAPLTPEYWHEQARLARAEDTDA